MDEGRIMLVALRLYMLRRVERHGLDTGVGIPRVHSDRSRERGPCYTTTLGSVRVDT
jgi:hypothetical protein